MNASVRLLLVLFGAATMLGAGCDNSNPDEDPARLRVIHAAADAATLDFYIDFDLFTRDLTFRQASPYIEWEPGLRLLEIRFTENGLTNSTTREVLLAPGTDYTVLLAGTDAASTILLLEDDRRAPPSGQVQIRVAHAARQAGPVGGTVQPQGGGAPVLFVDQLAFGTASAPTTADAGTYDFLLSSSQGSAALTSQTLEVGRRYLAVVTQAGSTTALALFLISDG